MSEFDQEMSEVEPVHWARLAELLANSEGLRAVAERLQDRAGQKILRQVWESKEDMLRGGDGMAPFEDES